MAWCAFAAHIAALATTAILATARRLSTFGICRIAIALIRIGLRRMALSRMALRRGAHVAIILIIATIILILRRMSAIAIAAIMRGILMIGLARVTWLLAIVLHIIVIIIFIIILRTIAEIILRARLTFSTNLRGHEQAIVMLCMLIVVFSHHTVARRNRIPRELLIFLTHMSRRTADLHIRTIAVKSTV